MAGVFRKPNAHADVPPHSREATKRAASVQTLARHNTQTAEATSIMWWHFLKSESAETVAALLAEGPLTPGPSPAEGRGEKRLRSGWAWSSPPRRSEILPPSPHAGEGMGGRGTRRAWAWFGGRPHSKITHCLVRRCLRERGSLPMSGFACSSLLVGLLLSAGTDGPSSPVGKHVDVSALAYCLGADAVAGWKQSRANVVVFLGTECPLAQRYSSRLAELSEKYRGQGVRFFGIDANQQDSLAAIAHFVQLHKIPFPVCKDPGNKAADRLGALRTPEAFVIDSAGVVRYWGLIDDQFGIGYAHDKAKKAFLEGALADVLGGRQVRTPSTPSVGCRIARVNRRPPKGDVTYSNQIARIFRANCVECHRAGEVAPFALTSYADAAAWAETIREVVDQGRMPPWRANPAHGKFLNDARLAEKDKQLIRDWIDNGVPEGDPSQLPAKAAFPDGWRIPKPDLIVKMPEPFTVPASGVVDYKYFIVDPGFTHDMWICGAEARPGN